MKQDSDINISKISQTLQTAYDELYTPEMAYWRELGGRYKAENIIEVSKGYSFSRVLECGAGEGSILKFLDASGIYNELYAIEISDTGITQIKNRQIASLKEVKKFDGYNIPYPDKYFDMVYCSHVIEHVEHPRILLRELKRISTYQVFEIPLEYFPGCDDKCKHFLSYGHINLFSPSIFKFLLKSEGYDLLAEKFSQPTAEIMRYLWYNYEKREFRRNIMSEIRLLMRPIKNYYQRAKLGDRVYNERAFSAYTCLVKGVGELKIF